LWGWLRGKRLEGYRFCRQFGVGKFILDFYCPKVKLGIEIDGGQHLKTEKKIYDRNRSQWLNNNNINILRFFDSEITSSTKLVCNKIIKRINEIEKTKLSPGVTPGSPLT
jgi:very-short-patch-repair endonuclease